MRTSYCEYFENIHLPVAPPNNAKHIEIIPKQAVKTAGNSIISVIAPRSSKPPEATSCQEPDCMPSITEPNPPAAPSRASKRRRKK